MKRLLVRLSLLAPLVAAGVFAIVQAQRDRGQAPVAKPTDVTRLAAANAGPPAVGIVASPVSPPAANPATTLIPLPAQFAASGGEYVLPAPTAAIVRGNNGGDETTAAPQGQSEAAAWDDLTLQGAPAVNLLAQADGATSRTRNPFARRSPSAAAVETEVQPAGYEAEGGASSVSAKANSGDGSAFPVNEPTLAAPASAPRSGYQEYNASAGSPAATDSTNSVGEAGASGSENPSAAAGKQAPSALGAPRELPEYGAAGNEAGAPTFAAPRAIGAAEPRATGQEPRLRGQEAGERNQGHSFGGNAEPRANVEETLAQEQPTAGGMEGAGTPGPQTLEGAQTPSVTIKKIAPPEIQVGKPASFEIQVQNVGRIPAHQVIIKEDIPRGVRLIDTAPPAAVQGGALLWELGTLQPGDSRQIKIQYLPTAEGDIGSVAVAAFQAQASVRTVCTRPQITVEQAGPEKVLIGESFTVRIRLANPGTGVATKVVLEEDVPEGFNHPSGRALEYEVGSLRPGETRDLDLTLQAAKPGVWDNTLVVRAEGNLAVEKSVKVEIVAPQLDLAMAGPTRRYLERQATYAVSIANPGTATAQDVKIVGRLPKGMKFVAANNEGQYDPKTHAVVWALAELPPGQRGEVQLTALPVETGEQKIVVEGKGNLDTTALAEQVVTVEALAELAFEITDKSDPIEVNKDTIYEVKVTNKGSKTATNIQVTANFPADMKPSAGDGPARAEVAGQRVIFEPLARLNPREQATFRIQAQGLRAGDQRIQVQVISDDSPTPVTKEESTRVYADE